MFSLEPTNGYSVTVAAAGTAVQGTALPDNCHTLVIYNSHAANSIFIRWQTTNAAITVANGTTIPAQTALTLSVGVRSQRPVAQTGGTSHTLWYDASGNGTVAYVTTVNGVVA
jgi:hypothetical protein